MRRQVNPAMLGASTGNKMVITVVISYCFLEAMSSKNILPKALQLGEESALGASVCALQPLKRSVISAQRSTDVSENPEK